MSHARHRPRRRGRWPPRGSLAASQTASGSHAAWNRCEPLANRIHLSQQAPGIRSHGSVVWSEVATVESYWESRSSRLICVSVDTRVGRLVGDNAGRMLGPTSVQR
jgi:hypothetical protein